MKKSTLRHTLLAVEILSFVGGRPAHPADCNENGIDDREDIAAGTSWDCNINGVPDECDVLPGEFYLEVGDEYISSWPEGSSGASLSDPVLASRGRKPSGFAQRRPSAGFAENGKGIR